MIVRESDEDRQQVAREIQEQVPRARAFVWYQLMRRTFPETSNEKHVLRVLADHADNDDGTCCVKQKTIAHESILGLTAVKDALNGLERQGIIERYKRMRSTGGKGASRYRILPSNPCER